MGKPTFTTTVYVDKDGKPIFARSWCNELIVSKIDLGRKQQCLSICPTQGGAVFCQKLEGHEGDHRGIRAQWNREGRRVMISEPLPSAQKEKK